LTISQPKGNFNGLYLRNDIYKRPSAANYKESPKYIVSKPHELWSTNGFKLEVNHAPSVKSAFHFIAMLRRRRSANGIQPNFAKRWTVGRANNLS